MTKNKQSNENNPQAAKDDAADGQTSSRQSAREIGGQAGPEPTRYGDWEKNGRCSDF